MERDRESKEKGKEERATKREWGSRNGNLGLDNFNGSSQSRADGAGQAPGKEVHSLSGCPIGGGVS